MYKAQSEPLASNTAPTWDKYYAKMESSQSTPWLFIKNHGAKIRYRFDAIAEFFGREDSEYDGVGFSFDIDKPLLPGNCLDVAIPLREGMRTYCAEVVSCTEILQCKKSSPLYEIGIWLRINSNLDLISLQKSCNYLQRC